MDIPHFTFGNIGADKSKRVANNCDANPTPTPVIDCCDGFSESVMFVDDMVQETDGVVSGKNLQKCQLIMLPNTSDGFGTFNCSFNFTSGICNHFRKMMSSKQMTIICLDLNLVH